MDLRKIGETLKIICVFVSQNRSNCLLNIMIIEKKSECNSIFFMILCIMIIVGGMARFSPALIYRRFIFETCSYNSELNWRRISLLLGTGNTTTQPRTYNTPGSAVRREGSPIRRRQTHRSHTDNPMIKD